MAETITDDKEVTSQNEDAQTEENLEARSDEGQQEEPYRIPKKFVGKSPAEILRAYNDLERQFHKVSSERADATKSKSELELRIKEIETRANSNNAVTSQQTRQPSEESEEDFLADYDEAFEADAKGTIKKKLSDLERKQKKDRELEQIKKDSDDANEYYYAKKNSDTDFAKLEPKMQQLAAEYIDLIKPNKVNSVKSLKLLHLIARGASVDDYVNEAVTRAKKETTSVKEEKRKASSESTRSGGDDSVDFKDLPLDEMRKHLGVADK